MAQKFIPFTTYEMFCEVMKDKEICKELIERIIGRPLDKIVYCNQQQSISRNTKMRSVRLDVCVETSDGTLIDVEMQVGRYHELPLRFRGYQSAIDASYWKRGAKFSELKETYIIFLCVNDPFSQGLPVYTIKPTCQQSMLVDIDCKTHWIALNAQAYEYAPLAVKDLLEYMKENVVSNDDLIKKIDKKVDEINEDPEKVKKMTTVQDRYDEYQHIIDDQKEEINSLTQRAESAEGEVARMTIEAEHTGLENARLKELLRENGIAFQ